MAVLGGPPRLRDPDRTCRGPAFVSTPYARWRRAHRDPRHRRRAGGARAQRARAAGDGDARPGPPRVRHVELAAARAGRPLLARRSRSASTYDLVPHTGVAALLPPVRGAVDRRPVAAVLADHRPALVRVLRACDLDPTTPRCRRAERRRPAVRSVFWEALLTAVRRRTVRRVARGLRRRSRRVGRPLPGRARGTRPPAAARRRPGRRVASGARMAGALALSSVWPAPVCAAARPRWVPTTPAPRPWRGTGRGPAAGAVEATHRPSPASRSWSSVRSSPPRSAPPCSRSRAPG